ncbi:MAG: lytic transglycosylase domain-containing protein [Leptospiraceae bacterium]|nr:lytic transglycosylase domain-containing protein [Leptospiraceae bacterium]
MAKKVLQCQKSPRFPWRPLALFVGFAGIALTAGWVSAYPRWQRHASENGIYAYLNEKFPEKRSIDPQELARILYQEARKIRLEQAGDGRRFDRTALLLAIIQVESEFNPRARSLVGARGLMQLMPATAAILSGRNLAVHELTDAHTNIVLGVQYLNAMIQEMGEVHKALLAYNAGPAAVRRYGGVNSYYEHVLRVHDQFLEFCRQSRRPSFTIARLRS